MNSANAHAVPAAADLRGHSRVAFVIAVIGAVIASAVVLFVSDTASAVAALILFCALFVVMLWLPALSSIAVGPRIVLALLTLRPLLDIGHSDTPSTAKFPLQGVYAVLFALVLIRAWKKARTSASPIGLPNIIILLLLASVIAAWVIGGLRFGTDGFVRTSWGLLVALLLGPLFTTPRQIDLFIRIVFCSSVLVLLVLAFNLDQGVYFDGLWRLGGQFGVPNALAAVAFSLFGYGSLYRSPPRKDSQKQPRPNPNSTHMGCGRARKGCGSDRRGRSSRCSNGRSGCLPIHSDLSFRE